MRSFYFLAARFKAKTIILIALTFPAIRAIAQTPQGLPKPHENDPLDLSSPFSIIYFVVIPLIALIAYFLLKKKKKDKNKE